MDNHGGSQSFQISIDAISVNVSLVFSDIYGNPLPSNTRVDLYPVNVGPDPSNLIVSAYLGVSSSAIFTLSLNAKYRIEYVGEGAPALPSFYTADGETSDTITPDGYVSPWANLTGYARIEDELAPLGRFVSSITQPSREIGILFTTFASTFSQLDVFSRTNEAGERLLSSVDAQVDSWATDFFGTTLQRLEGETNSAYIARIIAWNELPFGTLAAINVVVQQYFQLHPDDSSSVDVFDRQSDPVRSARYGLTPGQVAIIGYYPEPEVTQGWFMGQSFVGQTTIFTDPLAFSTSYSAPYAALAVQVNRVKAGGAVPVYIVSRGEP